MWDLAWYVAIAYFFNLVVSAFVQFGDTSNQVAGYFELQEIDGVNEVALAAVAR